MGAVSIEKQINNYLPQLTVEQKKAVLTVVKIFVEEQDGNINVYTEDFKKQLDNSYEEYINGGKLLNEKAANQRIKKIIHGKSKK